MWTLDKSISMLWLSLSWLPFFCFFKESYTAGSEDDTKSHHSFIITLSPFYITEFDAVSSHPLRTGPPLVLSLRGHMDRQTKQKTRGGKKCELLASAWALTYFTPPQTLLESISATEGKSWEILFFLMKGMNNHQTKNQKRLWKLQERPLLWND